MAEPTVDERIRAVLLYIDGSRVAEEICAVHGIPLRTFRRWVSAYRKDGIEALKPKRPGPERGTNSISVYHIKPIYGKPYHPRGRGKIESYHKVLYRELITQVRFTSLSHFKRELRKFDRKYNCWRKQLALAWKVLLQSTMTEDTSTRRASEISNKVCH